MATDPIHARLLSGKDAAAYCGGAAATFAKWVAAGMLPGPVMGRRWDKKAIDLALDRASGIKSIEPSEDVDEFAKWERNYLSRQATKSRTSAQREPWEDRFDAAWADWLVEHEVWNAAQPPSKKSSAADVEKARLSVWGVWKERYGRR